MTEPTITTATRSYQPKPWLLLLGVFVLALGLASGLLRSADLADAEFSAIGPSLKHRTGQVAGATIVEPGTATIKIIDQENPRTYMLTVTEAISVYNLFRTAPQQGALEVLFSVDDRSGEVTILSVDGLSPVSGKKWEVVMDGAVINDFTTPLVLPGMMLELRLARS